MNEWNKRQKIHYELTTAKKSVFFFLVYLSFLWNLGVYFYVLSLRAAALICSTEYNNLSQWIINKCERRNTRLNLDTHVWYVCVCHRANRYSILSIVINIMMCPPTQKNWKNICEYTSTYQMTLSIKFIIDDYPKSWMAHMNDGYCRAPPQINRIPFGSNVVERT